MELYRAYSIGIIIQPRARAVNKNVFVYDAVKSIVLLYIFPLEADLTIFIVISHCEIVTDERKRPVLGTPFMNSVSHLFFGWHQAEGSTHSK